MCMHDAYDRFWNGWGGRAPMRSRGVRFAKVITDELVWGITP